MKPFIFRARLLISLSILLIISTTLFARTSYTGYSGAPGRQNCASSCHGNSNGTVQVFGFPENYAPSTQYLISLRKLSGNNINNFNASIRTGTGSVNAGVIAAGNRTAIYNATGETNGVHLSQANRDTCNFLWTSPAAGTGDVTLYVAAFQGTNMNSGQNTDLVLVASEAAATPPQCTNPNPADSAVDVPLDLALSWTGNDEAWWYNIYFGETNPPPYITFQPETSFTPTDIQPNTTYYWKINPGNGNGETAGEVWQFTTLSNSPPGQAANPSPVDMALDVQLPVQLSWDVTENTDYSILFFDTENPPTALDTLTVTDYTPQVIINGTTYYWRVNTVNAAGTTEGDLWMFETIQPNASQDKPALPTVTTLGAPYPNPFNAETTIPFVLSTAQHITLTIYDMTGREVAQLADGEYPAGSYKVKWNSNTTASGVYLVRMNAGSEVYVAKILALK